MKSTYTGLLAIVLLPAASQAAPIAITATNILPIARASQTIEITAAQLAPHDLLTIHIQDANGKELVAQAVDTDGDAYRKPDIVIFQSDFAANESKSFTATTGKKQIHSKDEYKAFGRFVRERFDDFAWENDRIAHRTYGHALEHGKANRWPAAPSTFGPSARRGLSSTIGISRTTITQITAKERISTPPAPRADAAAVASGLPTNFGLHEILPTPTSWPTARSVCYSNLLTSRSM